MVSDMAITKAEALRLSGGFGIDQLSFDTVDVPQPGEHQVLVRVHAVSLNYRDLLVTLGRYNPKQHMPVILCSDGAGEVVSTGGGVTRFKPGDRVAAIFMQRWISGDRTREAGNSALGAAVDGMLTEYRVLDEEGLVAVPEHLSYQEASTLPCAAVTAWQTLVDVAHLEAGDTALILGTGGVSVFALQFARMHGARIIVTSSSDAKLDRARQLGASDVINYKTTPDWEKEVFRLTGGRGVDVVVEVGGAGTLPRSLRAVRTSGHIGVIGNLTGLEPTINIGMLINTGVHLRGIYVGSREMFEAMNRAISLHQMRPVIHRVFPFREAREAIAEMQKADHFGKLVISLE